MAFESNVGANEFEAPFVNDDLLSAMFDFGDGPLAPRPGSGPVGLVLNCGRPTASSQHSVRP